MPDARAVYTVSTLIHTGRGQLMGLVITNSSATSSIATFYDNTAGSGTKLLELHVSDADPAQVFFAGRFAPKFSTGLYLSLGSNLTATIWSRQL
jgi:hypothetical protein